MTVSGCTGECCRSFPVSGLTLPELWDLRPDVASMLIILPHRSKQGVSLYTCKFWNGNTKRCLIYPLRPDMCSDYPYDRACHVCGSVLCGSAADECGWYNFSHPSHTLGLDKLVEA